MAIRVGSKDFKKVAEFIKEEADDRRDARKDREKRWEEVDAQLSMDEEHAYKVRAKRTDPQKHRKAGDWMPPFVLPHQSTALEVLTSDARRMMLPEQKNWFECHAYMSDDVLEKFASQPLIEGQTRPIDLTQEELNAVCEAVLQHNHRKYDIGSVIDILNADAMKYGEFAARVRKVKAETQVEDFRGVWNQDQTFVALVPSCMKNTYPDESAQNTLGEGLAIQPSWVRVYDQKITDIKLAARRGDTDPENMVSGGWMPKNIKGLEPRKREDKGHIEVVEFEGDLVVDRSRDNIELFNKIVTVAYGRDGPVVIRYRDQEMPFRSYVHGVYHYESKDVKVGPLLKAAPLHNAMSEIFNRLIAVSILHTEPPISHSPDDRWFQSSYGPQIFPRAIWPTAGDIKVHQIGDPEKMLQVFLALLRMYEELTGVTAPRTGAQTKSHQTAFAIDQEISRGQIRTVDYVKSALRGPMVNWLHMEWEWLRRTMDKEPVYVEKLGGYIQVSGDMLPDVFIDAHGAAGPMEEAREEQKRMAALQMVMQLEPMALQLQAQPLNVDKIRKEVLRDGGWSDVEQWFKSAGGGVPQAPVPAGSPAIGGVTGG